MRALVDLLALVVVAGCTERPATGALQATAPCEILVPVLDTNKAPLIVPGPDGKPYPVFRTAPPSKLVDGVRAELDSSLAQQVLRLDRFARNLVAARRRASNAPAGEWLTAPMYLLLSDQEGGFARFGFWLDEGAGKRSLVRAGYVDLVVSENSVETGGFEEIFSHELGHLILKALTGGVARGLSRKMHQSMSVTDYPTAFDEGWAEHFQPLARDATKNPYLRSIASGTGASDLEAFWLSAADGQLRTEGIKRNAFVHRKPLPAAALDPRVETYRVFVEDETSTTFLSTDLKNGQEMMASEGVIATLFYRIVNDTVLRNRYREASFYAPFLGAAVEAPEKAVTPSENVNLKLFAAMESLRGTEPAHPPIIKLVEQYARLFPEEARRIYALFIETTWGATVSREVAAALVRASAAGHRGDITGYRQSRPFPQLDTAIAMVSDGKRALDANLGPELWVANTEFKIARAFWDTARTEPLTMNLNTASVAEWMTIPGIGLPMARRIVAARDARGWFRSVEDLRGAGVPADVITRLHRMQGGMVRLGSFERS